jgi:glyoxylase-like metal-dependent hydrolase (beta-lactamase superfamily II)
MRVSKGLPIIDFDREKVVDLGQRVTAENDKCDVGKNMLTTVVPVHHTPLNMVKSFLLIGERVVIVDAGMRGGADRIVSALKRAGRSPADVSLIVITHSHPDHASDAAPLKRLVGAPIAMNFVELKYVDGSERCPSTPASLAGRLFLKTPLPHSKFESFRPDLDISREFDLKPYGVDATVLPTGGHTPGHLAVYVPSTGELLAIDLLAGGLGIGGIAFHGRPAWPPFHEDKAQVFASLRALLKLPGLRKLHVCHGGPLQPDAVSRWIAKMDRLGAASVNR